jgi:thiol:disulfide interchange protein
MKKLFLFCLIALAAFNAHAQIEKRVKWTFSFSKPEAKVGETVDVIFKVDIDKGWHLYSNDFSPEVGPIPMSLKFTPHGSYQLVGKAKPIGAIKHFDEIFQGNVSFFNGKGEFHQTIKILQENPVIEGKYEGQACTDTDGRCVQENGKFKFEGLKVVPSDPKPTETATPEKEAKKDSVVPSAQPTKDTAIVSATPISSDSLTQTDTTAISPATANTATADDCSPTLLELLAAFIAGLVAVLTPCVYPMIPMTVAMFSKGEHKTSRVIFYGLSMLFIFTIIGTTVSAVFGPAALNKFSTHWLPNIIFFAVFIFFSLSFLGLFEITMPSWLVNKADSQADKGGLTGIFFVALTQALVSFSCTAPIVGSAAILAGQGCLSKALLINLAFGAAFSLPFVLAAIIPGASKKLPKSGGWLNTVKVFFGFLELAIALKFLSTPDQTYHWGILDREVYLALWIVIFALIGLNIVGKFRTPHDSKLETVSVPRIFASILIFAFVIYMIPGMFGAPLKGLSGLIPPETSFDGEWVVNGKTSAHSAQAVGATTTPEGTTPKYGEKLTLPHGLQGFFDFDEAAAYARKVNKPIFIDFTGHGCVNCRLMEANVWASNEVLERLKKNYVVVALYCDDKGIQLPESEWYKSKYDGETKQVLGDKNLAIQIDRYNSNAQPFYCLVDADGKLLNKPSAYNPNVATFVKFLDEGIAKFNGK